MICACSGPAWPCAVCGAEPTRFYHGGQVWICRKHDWVVDNQINDRMHAMLNSHGIRTLSSGLAFDELVPFTEADYMSLSGRLRKP